MLKIRDTVGDENAVCGFLADDAVNLHGKSLKAHGGVKRIFNHVSPAARQGLRVHHLLMVGKAEIYNPLVGSGHARNKLRGRESIVTHIFNLPCHSVSPAEEVKGFIKAVNAGADSFFHVHFGTSHNCFSIIHNKNYTDLARC